MADLDAIKEGKNFYENIPMKTPGYFLKGSNALDWGMKNRLARVFRPDTGRTVMLAIDHGYFQGPTTGLERVDLNIVPLLPYVLLNRLKNSDHAERSGLIGFNHS